MKTKIHHKDSIVYKVNEAIINIYRKGGNYLDVEKFLKSVGRESTIRKDIHLANLEIYRLAKLERESLINTHVKRYESIYGEHINKTEANFGHLPANIRKYAVLDCYSIALDALVSKEKVLGLHTKQFRVQLNNFFKKKIKAKYNFNQLEFNDLVRLKQLLEKMKLNEASDITYLNTDLEEETKEVSNIKDVDYVEVNTQVSDKIKEEVKIFTQESNEEGRQVSLENIQQKIIHEDIKKADPVRKSFLEKLSKINKNGDEKK